MVESQLLGNRYQIETQIGKGGMAVVYLAQDLMLERPVAIKILKQDFSRDPRFRERFRQEAKAAANLSHPNIVTVHDFGLDSGRLFIVMEQVPGTDLKTLIQNRGVFTVEETVPLMIQASAGIGYAHRAGLVHCDIKPHNILITPDKRVKVADFGIARALASINPGERSRVIWGSPNYFSPEQASGLPPSPASDVYSLGVIMYEMVTGRLPFTGSSGTELAQMHREVTPQLPSEINPDIPEMLEQIIVKVLSKEPSARYRTADQLGRVLLIISDQASKKSETPSKPVEETRESEIQQDIPVVEETVEPVSSSGLDYLNIDWLTVGLSLLALIAAGGLIPFWIWIYFIYNPPLP